MSAGFPPKDTKEIPLNGLSPFHALVLINETCNSLEWKVNYISSSGIMAYTKNGLFSWNAKIKAVINEDKIVITSSSAGNDVIDWGKNSANNNRFINEFGKKRELIFKEELDLKYNEILNQFTPADKDILNLPPETTGKKISNFFSIFIPVPGYYITPIIIDINIFVFVLMALSGVSIMQPDSVSLLTFGANLRPLTLSGDWWRLITNCYVHIGIFHILMNMYALLYIGVLLEPILGKIRFLTSYLATGLIASVASIWWNENIISAGASGAIFGMYGIFLALLTTNLIEKESRRSLQASIVFFVGYNLLYGMKGGIDNAAHIGGLLSGIVAGYAMVPGLFKPDNEFFKKYTVPVLLIASVVVSVFVCNGITNDYGIYKVKIERLSLNELEALKLFSLDENTPRREVLSELSGGIELWKENIEITDSIFLLDLSDDIKVTNTLLKQYCELRLGSYEYMYKAVLEDTNKYDSIIYDYNVKIENKLKILNSQE